MCVDCPKRNTKQVSRLSERITSISTFDQYSEKETTKRFRTKKFLLSLMYPSLLVPISPLSVAVSFAEDCGLQCGLSSHATRPIIGRFCCIIPHTNTHTHASDDHNAKSSQSHYRNGSHASGRSQRICGRASHKDQKHGPYQVHHSATQTTLNIHTHQHTHKTRTGPTQ